jgi:antitoxin component of MazEF toxin-antitoxin module
MLNLIELMHTSSHVSTLRALGGSVAITLPAPLVKAMGLVVGESVSFTPQAGGVLIAPIKRRKYSAADLVVMQGKKPVHIDAAWDKMPAMGSEAQL